jgi:hypothetical protein
MQGKYRQVLSHIREQFNQDIGVSQIMSPAIPVTDRSEESCQNALVAVMVQGKVQSAQILASRERDGVDWGECCLGAFHIATRYSGPSGHVCTGAFWVPTFRRRQGLGKSIGTVFLDWASRLVCFEVEL